MAAWIRLLAVGVVAGCGSTDPDAGGTPSADGSPIDAPAGGESDGAVEIDAATADEKIVFASSTRQSGDFGGLAGADALCASLAGDAGLAGTFRAWMSAPGSAAADRLSRDGAPYVRADGVEIAADWSDLVDGSIAAPINRDENGDPVGGDVWTGTLADGSLAASHCGGFDSAGGSGRCGDSNASGSGWTDNFTPPCSSTLRLYCVEQ